MDYFSIFKDIEDSLKSSHACGKKIKIPELFNKLKTTKPYLDIRSSTKLQTLILNQDSLTMHESFAMIFVDPACGKI